MCGQGLTEILAARAMRWRIGGGSTGEALITCSQRAILAGRAGRWPNALTNARTVGRSAGDSGGFAYSAGRGLHPPRGEDDHLGRAERPTEISGHRAKGSRTTSANGTGIGAERQKPCHLPDDLGDCVPEDREPRRTVASSSEAFSLSLARLGTSSHVVPSQCFARRFAAF
jgi:hypothetical protein